MLGTESIVREPIQGTTDLFRPLPVAESGTVRGWLSTWCQSLFMPLPAHLALPEAPALSRGPYLSCQLLHKDSCYARVGTHCSTLPAEEGTAAASHCPPSSLPDNLAPIPVLEVAGFATGSLLCLPSFTLLIFERHSLTHSLTHSKATPGLAHWFPPSPNAPSAPSTSHHPGPLKVIALAKPAVSTETGNPPSERESAAKTTKPPPCRFSFMFPALFCLFLMIAVVPCLIPFMCKYISRETSSFYSDNDSRRRSASTFE